jgi:hypothetical protein
MKASIILLYLRLFPRTVSRKFRIFCYLLLAAGAGFVLICIFVLVFACRPIHLGWSGLYRHYQHQCSHIPAVYYLALSVNVAADVLVFVMAIPKM